MGVDTLIELACFYDKKINRKLITNRPTRYGSFREEKDFGLLEPKYDVTNEEENSLRKKQS